MFNAVQRNKRIIQVVMFLIMLPFAFFGIESYFKAGPSEADVASFGSTRISQQEFLQALRDRQEQLQRMLGGNRVDPAMLDNPEMRHAVLDGLVQQRLMITQAVRNGLTASDAELRRLIAETPAFQQDGKFAHPLYDQFLKSRGKTPVAFESEVRRDLLTQQMADAFNLGSMVPDVSVDRFLRLNEQQREVSIATLAPGQFASQVSLDPAAVQKYYDDRKSEFQIPEQVRVEYVVLSLDLLASQIQLSQDDARKFFDENRAQISKQLDQPEQRQASHILIKLEAGADAAAKLKARTQAEALAKQARDKPAAFAELAKSNSQDPGSAESGGELGMFGRGVMAKPFEDAVFGMKVDEISGPVETQFGFHVIKLTGVQGGKVANFEEVRGQVESDLKKQRAGKQFAESAEQLSETVFTQSDSLKPAAEKLKLVVQQSPWISRRGAQGGPFGNEKFLSAVFSEDVLKNKRNTEVVEVAPNTLVAARVVEHKPSALRPFAEVSSEIGKRLIEQQAGQLANKEGRARLDKLKQGDEAGIAWQAAKMVTRAKAEGLPEPALRQAFRADVSKLPAFTGVENPQGGYTLIKIVKVSEPAVVTDERRKGQGTQLRQLRAQEEMFAYLASLKQKADVKVRQEALERKER